MRPGGKNGRTRQPLRVFIADDSQPVAEMLTELISAPGHIEIIGVGETGPRPSSDPAHAPGRGGARPATEDRIGHECDPAVRRPELATIQLMVTPTTPRQLRAGCLKSRDGYFTR
jgi:hypothetical protein